MKERGTLFTIAGVLKCIVGGFVLIIGLLSLLLGGAMQSMLQSSYDMIQEIINELATDPNFAYLLDYSEAEIIAIIGNIFRFVAIALIVIALIQIIFAIINFKYSKKAKNNTIRKGSAICFMIFSWLFTGISISNILTTVAVFLKPKDGVNENIVYETKSNF